MLLAATRLRMGGRRLRALACGDAAGVRAFVQSDSASRLTEARREARDDAALLEQLGARLVALGDPAFPRGLRDLRSPPAFLCVRGQLPTDGIAIVGTREPSDAGRAYARDLAAALGCPIVSGLARGIDAAAHHGALAGRAPQIAYVGNGLARTYPPEHAALADAIVADGGAIACERLPGDAVTRWSLMQRDRLQAAHAVAVVLVESEVDGGAMHTLNFARELGRPRFVAPLPSAGNALAIATGATTLASNVFEAAQTLRAHTVKEYQ